MFHLRWVEIEMQNKYKYEPHILEVAVGVHSCAIHSWLTADPAGHNLFGMIRKLPGSYPEPLNIVVAGKGATALLSKPPALSLGRQYGNGAPGAVILAAVIFHAEFHIGNDGHLFPALIRVFDNVGGTNAGAHTLAPIRADALFFIEYKLYFSHRSPPESGRSGFKPRINRA
jgi:hypothetical protein